MTYSLALVFGGRSIGCDGEDSSDDSEKLSRKHHMRINQGEVVCRARESGES